MTRRRRVVTFAVISGAVVSSACATSAVLGAVQPGDNIACDLEHLDACQNSNQLSSSGDKFERALRDFMAKAPVLRAYGAPGRAIFAGLSGPDGPPVMLPNGKLFFSGFTPHDGTQRGAAIFNPDGTILLSALLTGSTARILIIYVHDRAPPPDILAPVREWVEQYTASMYNVPGLPKYFLSAIDLYVRSDSGRQWRQTPLN